ncbi:MAG: hypothetical protein RR382_04745 [Tannerellaceae bacterium]
MKNLKAEKVVILSEQELRKVVREELSALIKVAEESEKSELVSLEEACGMLGCAKSYLYTILRKHDIVPVSKGVQFRKGDILNVSKKI